MSYVNYELGNKLPVEIRNGKVIIYFNTGEETYETTLSPDLFVQKQVLDFNLKDVLFVVESDTTRYIGYNSGNIAAFRISDDVLVDCASWVLPHSPYLREIGYVNRTGIRKAMLDEVRKRSVYFYGTDWEYVFNEPFTLDTFMPTALADTLLSNPTDLHIIDATGKEVDTNATGHWCISPNADRTCNRDIF